MIKEEKINQVEELAKEAAESGAVVFSDYSGLTVMEMSELRRKLTELGADLRVVKNTLLRLAMEKAGLSVEVLEGPTAALFSRSADPIESIKILVSYLKGKAKGEVKFGFLEKSFMAAAGLVELAMLPGKAVLQALLVSQLSAPIYRLAYVLSAQQRKLVTVLDAISKTKGGGE
ncbi:50S ribosomal protein L10 [candidate division WWE3 bacterium RIFCSPLOWO2_01_FULL_53_14]|uniref:Large ribosomal subunit protein uL10 n=1 Tax=candidate division WWE3 bacterium RIFCSPLOWO2_01_FULL_53_14 TaxID=1802628 RepID=A0A1F4W097_UNCKA|nr:MAG: 50S ribosomal protein L10 [candidate division WWE3 bacterium RIFCSPLOWO2_01_FULL_53_14]